MKSLENRTRVCVCDLFHTDSSDVKECLHNRELNNHGQKICREKKGGKKMELARVAFPLLPDWDTFVSPTKLMYFITLLIISMS